MPLSDEIKQVIEKNLNTKLSEKNRELACPICGDKNFILADGFGSQTLQDKPSGLVIGGPNLPQVVIVCRHCGNVIKFAAGVLGIPLEDMITAKKDTK